MKNSDLRTRVAEIFSRIKKSNVKTKYGHKRFWAFLDQKGNKLVDYGVYDYETKKYVMFTCYSPQVEKDLEELESFISK